MRKAGRRMIISMVKASNSVWADFDLHGDVVALLQSGRDRRLSWVPSKGRRGFCSAFARVPLAKGRVCPTESSHRKVYVYP